MTDQLKFDVAVVGGGISAVEAVRHFASFDNEMKIAFISGSEFVQAITSIDPISGTLFDFKLENISVENSLNLEKRKSKHISIFPVRAESIDEENKVITLSDTRKLNFDKLLLCTGAVPKRTHHDSKYCLTIRDTESALRLSEQIQSANRVVIIGNGGIALELVHALDDIEIVWCSRDRFGRKFLDEGALKFLLTSKDPKINNGPADQKSQMFICTEFHRTDSVKKDVSTKAAMGPNWYKQKDLVLKGKGQKSIKFISPVEVVDIIENESGTYPISVILSNGEIIEASFCIFGIGVSPETMLVRSIAELCPEGGVLIDSQMRSINIPWLFAAGDCCTCHQWPPTETENWIQMRLWTQARLMGTYAANVMISLFHQKETLLDYNFMNFAHSTRFFGFRTTLLGLFNGQKMKDDECEYLLRITEDEEYIKVIVKDDIVRGATIIYKNECDIEEVIENLIANQTSLGNLKDFLLDPNIDICDYFD